MTPEEHIQQRIAVAKVKLRLAGIHPEWIEALPRSRRHFDVSNWEAWVMQCESSPELYVTPEYTSPPDPNNWQLRGKL